MGAFWIYTGLRFGMFLALWGLLVLFGVSGFLGAVIALFLSIPLSYVLLRRPRAALSDVIEQRVARQQARQADLDDRLNGDA
jgi:hypothetical protein